MTPTSIARLVAWLMMIVSSVGAATPAVVESSADGVSLVAGLWRREGDPFTGILIERDRSGVARMALSLADGQPDGLEWRWYEDGQLESIRRYEGGRKVGRHRGWWPDGFARFEADYENDAFHGRYRAWYAGGRMSDDRTYFEGRERGSQRGWTTDGVLFFNYEVRDGRRFGLVNARPCVPAGKVTS